MYSSTCFGRPHAHHQELNNYSNSLWFYRWSVAISVLLFVATKTTKSDGRETVLVRKKQEEHKERDKMTKQNEEKGK